MVRACGLGLLLLICLAACSWYRIEPPLTASGQVCAAQCNTVRGQCTSEAESIAKAAAGSCSDQQNRIDDHCNNYTSARDRDHCQAVNQASHGCSAPSANTGSCQSDWEQCVLGCGGRMISR
jgi:hypothetical protein